MNQGLDLASGKDFTVYSGWRCGVLQFAANAIAAGIAIEDYYFRSPLSADSEGGDMVVPDDNRFIQSCIDAAADDAVQPDVILESPPSGTPKPASESRNRT